MILPIQTKTTDYSGKISSTNTIDFIIKSRQKIDLSNNVISNNGNKIDLSNNA